MNQNTILRIALPTPLRRLFDYLPPQGIDYKALKTGTRVSVPFQSRNLVGILISIENSSSLPYEKLKRVTEILDFEPILAPDVYKLCQWAADYYHYSLGEVLSSALPKSLRKGKPVTIKQNNIKATEASQSPLRLNSFQQQAVQAISAAKNTFKVFLLNGVTGSGKTEVYLHAMEETIKLGKQVLLLVPEISLTPQTLSRLSARFSIPIFAHHSNLSEKKRLEVWSAAKHNEAKIVIGTRSAIFTPFTNLGLIVVDEEHDTSFKQQDRFRYHARDLAIMRANFNHIPIVLGSATPSLESLQNAKRQRYTLLSLPQRAGNATLPHFHLIDLRHQKAEHGLSLELITMMKEHLDKDNQVMLYLNRRGFSPVLYCRECASIVECKRCDARMVYHLSIKKLKCHHCDGSTSIPTHCEKCGEVSLQAVGVGTQRVEQALMTHFPDIPIIRVDKDNTVRKGEMQRLLNQIHNETKAILLGTQMLAKGHHFPNVTLVGIIDADAGLFSVDFRAAEQIGQLLMQVAGRAGRADKAGRVAIQTRNPENDLLQTLIQKGYQTFAENLLNERELALLPPFSYFAIFRAESYKEKNVNQFLSEVKVMMSDALTVLGPVPAILSKRKGLHCQHLLVKTHKRSLLQQALNTMLNKLETLAANYSVKWILDVDPIEV